MKTPFFGYQSFFVDQKVNFFKFETSYQIYNDMGEPIGSVNQKLSLGQKFQRLLFKQKNMPYQIEIRTVEAEVLAIIEKSWTFWMPKTTILDANGVLIARIVQKFKFLKPEFEVWDAQEERIGKINGDWKSWNFVISDAAGMQIGSINKKWAGSLKEIFTTADKYHISIDAMVQNPEIRKILFAGAIVIDMALNERK